MTTPACQSYAGYRFPAEIISHAVWLYFRFPLSLRMVDELLAARGIAVSHETGVAARFVQNCTLSCENTLNVDPSQSSPITLKSLEKIELGWGHSSREE
jgi:transposase-like protein